MVFMLPHCSQTTREALPCYCQAMTSPTRPLRAITLLVLGRGIVTLLKFERTDLSRRILFRDESGRWPWSAGWLCDVNSRGWGHWGGVVASLAVGLLVVLVGCAPSKPQGS